jgi:hypothetical protein
LRKKRIRLNNKYLSIGKYTTEQINREGDIFHPHRIPINKIEGNTKSPLGNTIVEIVADKINREMLKLVSDRLKRK